MGAIAGVLSFRTYANLLGYLFISPSDSRADSLRTVHCATLQLLSQPFAYNERARLSTGVVVQ